MFKPAEELNCLETRGRDNRPPSGLAQQNGITSSNLSTNRWQSSRSYALPDTLEMLVRRVELDVLEVGELCLKNFFRRVEHYLATVAGAHAAHYHEVVDYVVLTVLGNGVAKVDANRLVDFAALRRLGWILHGRLDKL